MDLASIIATVWRHKLATIPVIMLTLLGAFYVFAIKAPVYEASAGVLLVAPPAAPSAAQIAADPALANVDASNPYLSYGDFVVAADAVISQLSSPSGQHALIQAGADPRYQVALSTAAGDPPIVMITGVGRSAQEAIKSAELVTAAVSTDLRQLQQALHVNSKYMITADDFLQPTKAQTSVSSKLRTLIAVFAIGAILLLIAVSVSQTVQRRRDNSPGNRMSARTRYDETAHRRGPEEKNGSRAAPGFRDDTLVFPLDMDGREGLSKETDKRKGLSTEIEI
jgi:hypothetical protein